jgi:diphthine synthase
VLGSLTFIGLGLNDEKDITIKGLEAVRECETVFAEFYTSFLSGTTIERIENVIGRKITLLSRQEVENENRILDMAVNGKVAFLTAGDPMTATTHVSLRIAATKRGIPVHIIHNASIVSAASGALGLQNYKFGRTLSLAFQSDNFKPVSAYEGLSENLGLGLHTLILLDLKPEEGRFMTANEGIQLLLDFEKKLGKHIFLEGTLVCALGRIGSESQVVRAGKVSDMLNLEFGAPPHSLVVPGKLHFMEEEALNVFTGLR